MPKLLKIFSSELITSSLRQMTISEAIFSATRTRSVMPLQLGLAVAVDNQLASKWLNSLLSRLGFAVSYDEVIRFKQNIVAHDSVDEVVCPLGTTFMQYVGDNTDHDIATVDGKNTHHGLGSIAIANGVFADINNQRRPLPRDRKRNGRKLY